MRLGGLDGSLDDRKTARPLKPRAPGIPRGTSAVVIRVTGGHRAQAPQQVILYFRRRLRTEAREQKPLRREVLRESRGQWKH